MNIVVKSLEELLVDGKNKGPVIPALVSLALDPDLVQAALYNWRDGFLTGKAEELQQVELSKVAAVEEAAQAQEAAILELKEQHAREIEELTKPDADKLREQLEATKAQIDAELEKLAS